MSDYNVYLKVPEYLAQWIAHSFGSPVSLIKDSPEMRLLNELLVKTPCDRIPDTGDGANVIIPIPYFKGKDPRYYNFLYNSGKNALEDSFSELFKKNLFLEVSELRKVRVKRAAAIYAYMEKHGIDEIYWDTVAQIFHRLNQKYFREKDLKIA